MMAALERCEAHGTAVALSTHDVDLALSWADEVAVVHDHTVRQGPPLLLGDEKLLAEDGRVDADAPRKAAEKYELLNVLAGRSGNAGGDS